MGTFLDRAAVERILRRANEIADADPDRGDMTSEQIDARTLVEAAEEAGIPASAVQRSLAIEQLGATPGRARLDTLVGPATISVEREVDSTPAEALELLDTWLRARHFLRQERLLLDEMVWTKRKGLAASALRSTRKVTGEGRLGDVASLRAQVAGVGDSRSLIRVSIDRKRTRRTRLTTGSALGVGGAAAAATVALFPVSAVIGVPVAVAGYGTARSAKREAAALEREVVRLLDAVALGKGPKLRR